MFSMRRSAFRFKDDECDSIGWTCDANDATSWMKRMLCGDEDDDDFAMKLFAR